LKSLPTQGYRILQNAQHSTSLAIAPHAGLF
jgi:hypothetical protein